MAVAKKISVLGALSWGPTAADEFLSAWRGGNPALPRPPEVRPLKPGTLETLRDVERRCDRGSPRGRFVIATAASYRRVGEMLAVPGTKTFYQLSRETYGGANERLAGTKDTQLSAADMLLASTADLTEATREDEYEFCLTAEHVREQLQARVDAFFGAGVVQVVIDRNLSAKAAASAERIRVRSGTCFTPADIVQLTEHEAFIHAATALNGRRQQRLACLSLGSPRTTATQEGIATFAELITGAIDLARLRRLALRIRAVHLAEEGADFIDVFRFLLDAGQTEGESVQTAMRVFRGGDVRGRHVFTKDVVYLRGLLAVHTFLRKAIAENRPELIARMFVGRLSVTDVLDLEESFESGLIAPAVYLPAWARNVRSLAAYLSFSLVTNRINLSRVDVFELCRDPLSRISETAPT
ncbi:MAG: DUF1704 domain-containing protein [Myxococcales bacterium]|nr:DUF1704 domain-containing protein [Myxococcales bacterium]